MSTNRLRQRVVAASLTAAAPLLCFAPAISRAATLPYSTDFESPFTPGTIDGQGGWYFQASPTASPPSTGVVTNAAAHSGTQSLKVNPVLGDGNVIKISTPNFDPSGETPSVNVPAPASSYMAADFWFRTVSAISDPGLYVSSSLGNPASVRNTWLGVLEGSNTDTGIPGNLYVSAIDYDASGNEREFDSPALQWGQWYHATVAEQYVNGPDNDKVTYSISDASNAPVWSTTIGSWENLYATDPTEEQAPGPVVSDRLTFGGHASTAQGIYVDDFSMTNVAPVPEPTSLSVLGIGGLAMLRRRRRRA
jgi:hypothetical protein